MTDTNTPSASLPRERVDPMWSGRSRATIVPRHRPRSPRPGPALGTRRAQRGTILTRHPLTALVAGIVVCGTGLRLWLILRGWPRLDSDVAIIGLMARHILYNGARPAFYYGQHYMGSLDAYIAAGAFAVLGPTPVALALSTLPLSVGVLVASFWLGRAVGGATVGLATLTYFALGPALALYLGGAYPPFQIMLLLGALLCWLVYRRLREPQPMPVGRRSWLAATARYAAFGVVAGLGIWSDELLLTVVAAGILVLAVARPHELFHLPGLALLAGMVAGGWPFLAYNLGHGWGSFAELAAQSRPPTQHGLLPPLPNGLAQIWGTLTVGLPVTLGSPHVCVTQGGLWAGYPPWMATAGTAPLCAGLNAAFSLAVLACYAAIGVRLCAGLARGMLAPRLQAQRLCGAPRAVPGGPATARAGLRAMLLLVALATLALYVASMSARTSQFTAARYLIPLYLSVPLIFAPLWELARPALKPLERWLGARYLRARVQRRRARRPRLAERTPPPARRPVVASLSASVAVGAILLLLGFATYGTASTAVRAADSTLYSSPLSPRDQSLLATLDVHGVTRFTSDYWTCFRIAFESGERIRCAVRSQNGLLIANGAINRYAPYMIALERTPFPAYIFPAGGTLDREFVSWAEVHHLPHVGYLRVTSAEYAVYYHPGAAR